ncbi:MAG: transposase [Flavonifractor plautii]
MKSRRNRNARIGIVRDHLHYIEKLIERVDICINTMVEKYDGAISLLRTIPGIDRSSAITVISEIGVDMAQFGSSKRLCCWAGLTPGNNESAGQEEVCPHFTCGSLSQTCAGASCPRSRERQAEPLLRCSNMNALPNAGERKELSLLSPE